MVLKKSSTVQKSHFVPLSTRLHSRTSEDIEEFNSENESSTDFQSPEAINSSIGGHDEPTGVRKFDSSSTIGSTNIMHKFRNVSH